MQADCTPTAEHWNGFPTFLPIKLGEEPDIQTRDLLNPGLLQSLKACAEMVPRSDQLQSNWVVATLFLGALGFVGVLYTPATGTKVVNNQTKKDMDKLAQPFLSSKSFISKRVDKWADPFESVPESVPEKVLESVPEKVPENAEIDLNYMKVVDSLLKDQGELLIIPKIMPGEATDKARESRIRNRHAMELAFVSSGYQMHIPDSMTYVQATFESYITKAERTEKKIVVPVTLYTKEIEGKVRLLLVFWVDQEQLGERPMRALAQMLNSIFKSPSNCLLTKFKKKGGVAICGPNSSNYLQNMVTESKDAAASGNDATEATATDDLIAPIVNFFEAWEMGTKIFNSVCTAPNVSIGLKTSQKYLEFGKDAKLLLVHTIGEDVLLIDLLKNELEIRGHGNSANGITILFVEQQSQAYINALRTEFANGILGPDKLRIIPYFKGIFLSQDTVKDVSKNDVSDYFDRTFADLRDVDNEKVIAVGVFGSEWSDKYTVFRSARRTFPTAAFFTTELDARYAERKYYPDCRNLIVASHYGLSCTSNLIPEDGQYMPSFRDGYQTSIFLSALIALLSFEKNDSISGSSEFKDPKTNQDYYDICGRSDRANSNELIKPLLFEIASTGAFQLKSERLPSGFTRHRLTPPGYFDDEAVFFWLAGLMFICILVLYLMRPYSGGVSNMLERAPKMLVNAQEPFTAVRKGWIQLTRPDSSTKDPKEPAIGTTPVEAGNESRGANTSATEDKPEGEKTPRTTGKDQEKKLEFLTAVVFLMVLVSSATLFGIAWYSDVSMDGERLSWFEGISVWPSVLLFHLVAVSSAVITLRYARYMQADDFRRGVGIAILLLILIMILFGSAWFDAPPARGLISRQAALFALLSAAGLLFLLASLSTIYILRARKQISDEIKDLKRTWEPQNRNVERSKPIVERAEELLKLSAGYFGTLVEKMKQGELASLALIAPAALTVVLAIARLPFLDSWGIPKIWYAALMTPLFLSLIAAFILRSEARKLRAEACDLFGELHSELIKDYGCRQALESEAVPESTDTPKSQLQTSEDRSKRFNDCIQKVSGQIDSIKRLDRGPFGSIYSDPLLGGVLLIITASLTGPMRDLLSAVAKNFGF